MSGGRISSSGGFGILPGIKAVKKVCLLVMMASMYKRSDSKSEEGGQGGRQAETTVYRTMHYVNGGTESTCRDRRTASSTFSTKPRFVHVRLCVSGLALVRK